jgi:hypothetical protein
LTWQNLGWRIGKKYGARSRDEIVTLYEALAENYRQNRMVRVGRFLWSDADVELHHNQE